MKKALLMFMVCVQAMGQNFPKDGLWRAEIPTAIGQVPIHLLFEKSKAYSINGKEKLAFDTVFVKNDSVHIKMEIFDAEIVAKVSENKMNGIYTKKLGNLSNRSGQFTAEFNQIERFSNGTKNTKHDVSGKYDVLFKSSKSEYKAVGVFEQNHDIVNGTFLTTAGDYRFLNGNIVGDSLKLSAFDGTHIYYFKAKIAGNELEGGQFCSSLLNVETWEGHKNSEAKLPDANSLTYLKPDYKTIAFSFPDENGKLVTLNDDYFKNKVTIIQIMGSWCPNCMDETRFLTTMTTKYKNLAVVGLAFEKSLEPEFVKSKFKSLRSRFGVKYPVLIAGKNSSQDASEKLPMLSKVLAFPTSIILDKKGMVREIHTGFSGPGTGIYYENYRDQFMRLIDKLERE